MRNDKELHKAVLAVMLGKKDEQVDEAKKPLHPNQQKLDVHEPEKDELTAKDFEMLRAGKKSKDVKEEIEMEEEVDETIIYHNAFDIEIKESYTFGEYLNAAKNIVGEELAIELANEAYKNKDATIFAEEVTRTDIEGRIKQHQSAGHKVSMPKYSTRDGKLHAEYTVTDKESGVRRKYIHHGNMRKVENMGTAGKKDQE